MKILIALLLASCAPLNRADVAWVKETRAREEKYGACVPNWKDYPWFGPEVMFTFPTDGGSP